ncbi:PQQ-dependent sugar dehydrogenase [Nocardioides coralli]|uniref:PQQ-dependent sugar dehydrogenase n=1 Tax=Nocardioides coralli TaxID=2872154 RepID=UPI001CA3C6F7|nr:PQQ-dependent sugar dehydrogenase [Nocardioides coralli]QZY28237.1 PQQ-dependent sugar dehydrogenase [Nocardioides coralli]
MRLPVALLVLLVLVGGCGAGADDGPRPATVTATPEDEPSEEDTGPPRVVAEAATGLSVPWGLDFLPDGRAVVTERDTAQVLLVDPGSGSVATAGRVASAAPQGEAGLLGVAVSPGFDDDRLLYLYVSTAADNRIVRAELGEDDSLGEPEVVLDGIPNGFIHDGGRLVFSPDGNLFASTGEIGVGELAQDPSSLAGKILRITPDGEPAPGNPDPDSPVWSLGHRNVQGLAFDDAGNLWASEFGSSSFDELNLVEAGGNYGWPRAEGRSAEEAFVNPRIVWSTDEASPSGLAYAEGHLWLAALRGTRLWRIDVEAGRASNPQDFFVGDHGRLRTVAVAPDGRLWVTTSNRDGRGEPAPGDDRILVVEP